MDTGFETPDHEFQRGGVNMLKKPSILEIPNSASSGNICSSYFSYSDQQTILLSTGVAAGIAIGTAVAAVGILIT